LNCRPDPRIVRCQDNGVTYAPGDVRRNPNGCGVCVCDDSGAWQCPAADRCPVTCATVTFTVSWPNPPVIFTEAEVRAILERIFGVNAGATIRFEITRFSSEPSLLAFTVVVRCINLEDKDRDAALALLRQKFGASFSFGVAGVAGNEDSNGNNPGNNSPQVGYTINDPGEDVPTTGSASTLSFSFIAALVAFLAIFA
jgi:hypothetical protein